MLKLSSRYYHDNGWFSEDAMVRWIVALCSVGAIAALSVSASEAAKAARKPAEKVEYLRATGSEPTPPPVKQARRKMKATRPQ